MREERIYSLLLSAKDMFKLYSVIGDTLKSKTDFANYSSNNESCKNAFELLKNICLASFEDGEYKKTKIINDESSFNKELVESLITNKEIPIKDIFNCDVFYDSFKNSFYINRNSIKLDYSGLIMLMIDLSILGASLNRLYFNDHRLLNLVKPSSSIKIQPNVQLNPDLLDKLLELEQKLGNEAEEKAFAFEKKRLFSLGITMEPLHISKIDCKAGFDIASYERDDDKAPSRFIEVKSVNTSLHFYISKNEIECSKVYGDKYFIYLYNREKKSFVIIQNPYKEIFSNNKWEKTPQLYDYQLKK